MDKRRACHSFMIILISVACLFFVNAHHLDFPRVLAQTEWVDTFNIYHNITVLEPNIRTISNDYDFPVDVKVFITDVTNIAKILLYKTFGNSTEFIYIKDGVTLRTGDTYTALQPGETLAFDILAKPSISLSIGETITVQKKVEIYKAYVPPPIVVLPPVIIKFPLDLKIVQLPSIVYQPLQPTFKATLFVTNKAMVAADVTIKWWVIDAEGKTYDGGETTLFISGMDKKEIEIEVPTPQIDGRYTLHAQSTIPTVVVAEGIFDVKTFPIWLIVVILIACVLTLAICIKKRKG